MAAAGRYAATTLGGATESERAVLCADCGALVADTAAHDRFHGQAPVEVRERKPRPEKIT